MEENKKYKSLVNSVSSKENLTTEKKQKKGIPFIVMTIGLILILAIVAFIGVSYIKYRSFTKNIYKQDAELLKKQSEILPLSRLPYKKFNAEANEISNSRNKLVQDIESQNIILFNSKLQSIKTTLKEENKKFISELMNNPEYALQVSNAKLYTKIRDHYVWYPKKLLQENFLVRKYMANLSEKEVENLKDGYWHNEPCPDSKRFSLTLTNNSDREFSNIVIKVAVYKNVNNEVGTFTINVANLQPHKIAEIDDLLPVKFWDAIGFEKNAFYWDLKVGDINFIGNKNAQPYIDKSSEAYCEVVKISGK